MNTELLIKEKLGSEDELINGECVLLDSDGNHYLTIKENNGKLVLLYPINAARRPFDNAIDYMILNGHPEFVGKASLFFGYDNVMLVLSVFGEPETISDFEKMWDDGRWCTDKDRLQFPLPAVIQAALTCLRTE